MLKRFVMTFVGVVFFVASTGCGIQPLKVNYRIGTPKAAYAVQPFLYQQFLPKDIQLTVMTLDQADELVTALRVEAIDAAILPLDTIIKSVVETPGLVILTAVSKVDKGAGMEPDVYCLVVKDRQLEKYRAGFSELLGAHLNATAHLKSSETVWKQHCLDLGLTEVEAERQMNQITLVNIRADACKALVQERVKQLMETRIIKEEPDYKLLFNRSENITQ